MSWRCWRQHATTLDEYVYTSDDDVVAGNTEPGRRRDEKDFNRIIKGLCVKA